MKEPFVLKDGLLWLEDWMARFPELTAGFTTTLNGFSAEPFKGLNLGYHVGDSPQVVGKNREEMAKKVGIPLNHWVFAQQLHTKNVQEAGLGHAGAGTFDFDSGVGATDGLFTDEPGVVLGSFYADCTPVYFYVRLKRIVGVAHAGWKGTASGIVLEMVEQLKAKGAEPADIFVAIGPAISQAAYRVDEKVIQEVGRLPIPNPERAYVDLGGGQYKLDVKLLNVLQALHAGVPSENISVSSYCTYTDTDLFYSHRRTPGTGRMAAFICLRP